MIVADLVAGDSVFVDSNILIYHFGPHPTLAASCSQLVQRIENLDVHGFTSSHVLGEVAHRLMVFEASTAAGVPQQILGTAQDITARKRLEELLQERRLHRQEVVAHLRQFRDGLGLSQSEFGQTFGGYSQRQISSYESGAAEFPLDLLLAIRAKGYPLEAVLGVGSTAVIDQTVRYLSSSHAVQLLAQQLVEALGRLLARDAQATKQILQELGIPATALTRVAR